MDPESGLIIKKQAFTNTHTFGNVPLLSTEVMHQSVLICRHVTAHRLRIEFIFWFMETNFWRIMIILQSHAEEFTSLSVNSRMDCGQFSEQ